MDTDQDQIALGDPLDEFERLGRRAGAELRASAPSDGVANAHLAAARHDDVKRVARVAGAVATIMVVIIGLAAIGRRPDPQPGFVSIPTTQPSAPPATTIAPAPPGQWRVIDASPLSPVMVVAATWTGSEAIVLGTYDPATVSAPQLVAVAYDVGTDTWSELAEPPPLGISQVAGMAWTGDHVLLVSRDGGTFSYDRMADVWSTGAAAPPLADEAVIGVSTRGALLRDDESWQWYDAVSDRWTAVTAPPRDTADVYTAIDDLDAGRMIAANPSIAYSVFDIETLTWNAEVTVDGPPRSRGPGWCIAAASKLVCWAEGFGSMDGVVVDPDTTQVQSFGLGNHASAIDFRDVPWYTHAWGLLSPDNATWEELPPLVVADSFDAAIWTGTELVMFGGSDNGSGARSGTTAAYTPISQPG